MNDKRSELDSMESEIKRMMDELYDLEDIRDAMETQDGRELELADCNEEIDILIDEIQIAREEIEWAKTDL